MLRSTPITLRPISVFASGMNSINFFVFPLNAVGVWPVEK